MRTNLREELPVRDMTVRVRARHEKKITLFRVVFVGCEAKIKRGRFYCSIPTLVRATLFVA